MDRDPATERDVARDRIARHRRAALRNADEHVLDAGNNDADSVARDRGARLRRLQRDCGLFDDLFRLQAVQYLVYDLAGTELPRAERDVEVLGLLEAGLADHLREHARALELAVRQVLRLERVVERFAALVLELFARLSLVPLADLVARPRRSGEAKPVARRPPTRLRRQDLDEVAVLQLVVKRHDAAVDLRADGLVPDVGVDGIGEVDRRRARRQRLHLALRREDVHLVVEEIGAQRAHELGGVLVVALPIHQRLDPDDPLVVALRALATLVQPVRSDAELGFLVHLARPQLDLERRAGRPDHRRVQRAVAVQLRHRDEVLEAPRHRLPQRVDQPERAVTVARPFLAGALDNHAHRGQVVDLVELPTLLGHLVVDRVEVLRAAGDIGGDVGLLELGAQCLCRLLDLQLTVGATIRDHRLDLGELARVQHLEREVFELPFQMVDTEPVRERRVHLERFFRFLHLLLLAEVLDRAQVVEAVSELDQDDAHVLRHRHDHLAVVLGLRLLAALERRPGQLGDALDEMCDVWPELVADVVELGIGVLDDIV